MQPKIHYGFTRVEALSSEPQALITAHVWSFFNDHRKNWPYKNSVINIKTAGLAESNSSLPPSYPIKPENRLAHLWFIPLRPKFRLGDLLQIPVKPIFRFHSINHIPVRPTYRRHFLCILHYLLAVIRGAQGLGIQCCGNSWVRGLNHLRADCLYTRISSGNNAR